MFMRPAAATALALALGTHAFAQQRAQWGQQWNRGGYGVAPQPSRELTVDQMRKLGLSDEQIVKITEQRRDLEKEREKLEAAMTAMRSEMARIGTEMQALRGDRLAKVYESVMSKEQFLKWQEQGTLAQAKGYLQRYRTWLKLSDTQVQDIAHLLVPVYAKHAKADRELADMRARIGELRRADAIDVAAIDEAEKALAEMNKQRDYRARQAEYMETLRAGLMPDQLERLDQRTRGR